MIVVIGAGIMGLSIAYELAKRGAKVRVLEADASAASASWSGAGRLAPFSESEGDEELEMFLATALGTYQVFVGELHKRTGVDPYLRVDGIVHVAHDDAAVARLRKRVAALAERGIHAHWLEADEIRALEPWLGPATLGASLIEDEGQIDNRELGRALRYACADAGVVIEEQTGRVALETDGERVVGVRARDALMLAEAVVNAAGPWAGELGGVPPHVRVPIVPVKGQLVIMAMPQRWVKRLIYVPGAYLIPRPADGTLVIGETETESGFDLSVDPAASERLRQAAVRAIPALEELTITQAWAGLRPRTVNGRPYVGSTALEGYYVAAGHDRNAILLAPATAMAIANVIEGKASQVPQ
jgi:glycine oxidase